MASLPALSRAAAAEQQRAAAAAEEHRIAAAAEQQRVAAAAEQQRVAAAAAAAATKVHLNLSGNPLFF